MSSIFIFEYLNIALTLCGQYIGSSTKTSVYFYFGIDGLGSLDLENEEDEDVRITFVHQLLANSHSSCVKGLSGIVKFEGSTPDLGEFSIRVEDGVFS